MAEDAGIAKEELLKYAAHAESFSSHPISKGVVNSFKEDVEKEQITDVTEIAGHGVTAICFGKKVAVGNEKLMSAQGIAVPEKNMGPAAGQTGVYVAVDNIYVGFIIL